MRYLALACDFDETLARQGQIHADSVAALEKLLASGRKLILVTGREFADLLSTCPVIDLFSYVVAENGAIIYSPSTKEETLLADAPPERFFASLRKRSIPFSRGRLIVSTGRSYDTALLQSISDLGLEYQLIYNKGSVMLLPSGVNKATGLSAALGQLKLSPHNVVGIGDAENDYAFLSLCESSVAVSNALPSIRERADFVTAAENGAGVVELIEELLDSDLRGRDPRLTRRHILLGTHDGHEVRLPPYSRNILLAGESGGGKSTLATGFLERVAEAAYQFCVVDPEGDYESFESAIALGNNQKVPQLEEILKVLADPDDNVVVNLISLDLADRPAFLLSLLSRLQEMRAQTGRPHWIVIDEAHHVLPSSWDPAVHVLPRMMAQTILITVEPQKVMPTALQTVNTVVIVGAEPRERLKNFCQAIGQPAPSGGPAKLDQGEALFWSRDKAMEPVAIKIAPNRTQRRRHQRKYAEGELPEDRSFYFTGPNRQLKLRSQNLLLFIQIGEGVDDETWLHHLRQGDYSRWFREAIKDEALADEAAKIESSPGITAAESRRLIKETIEKRYTLPE
ncbi:MAG TPA: HAD hydrolase family protein [Candidatus Binatia bacterium]|nr:HAD hydrolase family protein [Candidatus Binatia bacterium]